MSSLITNFPTLSSICLADKLSTLEIIFMSAGIIISLAAVIVSIYALIVARRTLNSDLAHNMVSVKPVLNPRYSSSAKKLTAEFYIENTGFGMLMFTKFEIRYEGKTYKHMYEVMKDIHMPNIIRETVFSDSSRTYSLVNYSMHSGKRKNLIRFTLNRDSLADTGTTAKEYYNHLVDRIKLIEFHYSFQDIYEKTIEEDYFRYYDIYDTPVDDEQVDDL